MPGGGVAITRERAADVGGLLHGVGHLALGRAILGPRDERQVRD